MLDKYLSQLKEFQQDDEARWKYEAEQRQQQLRLRQELGRSEKQVKAGMEQAGINVQVLEEESKKSARQLEKLHQELLKIGPPPGRSGRKDAILLQADTALTSLGTWLFPPAYQGWGDAEKCGFNLALGEINNELHSSGAGGSWGWEAFGTIPQHCTLWFYYFPPQNGELLVQPHVDFQGSVAMSADDHWYTSTEAELHLDLYFDLYQHYWDGGLTDHIISEHLTDSSKSFFLNDHHIMTKTMSVSAHDIVWIKLTTILDGWGKSDDARVDYDFRTGSDRRIRVEHIWVNLDTGGWTNK